MIKRNTIQRTLTLEAVQSLHDHPTADEVYEEISREHPSISRGTVYRNLKQLAEDGYISERKVPGGADRFDHITAEHYHVRCLLCGRIYDVDMDLIPDLEGSIKDTHGFKFLGYDLVFKGICPQCIENEAGANENATDPGEAEL